MKQTNNGKQWHFSRCAHPAAPDRLHSRHPAAPSVPGGIKVHVETDARAGVVHAAVVTAADVHDKHAVLDLLHGEQTRGYGDRGYEGCTDLIKEMAPTAREFTNRRVRQPWSEDEVARAKNRTKNCIRARVERVFHVLRTQFGFAKVRYRGLVKNATRMFTALALAKLILAHRRMPALLRP